MKRDSGSALIITMLIVAAISAASFGISRIFLADVQIAGSLEDSLMAYYLAEAGVEEGLLRYRIDRTDVSLNEIPPVTRGFDTGSYQMSTTFLTIGDMSEVRIDADHAFDTGGEGDAGNRDFRNGLVPQDETVEAGASEGADVNVAWEWDKFVPANPECGVEITSVLSDGSFDKVLIVVPGTSGISPFAGGRTAVRVKPLCNDLAWVAFGSSQPLGRTLQTVESTGTVGRAKRRLQATVNRRAGSIVGFFDFVIGCGIETGDCPELRQ